MYDSNYVMKTINILRLEQINMKFTALAKATLALGILTTGTLTTEVHSGHAKQNQKSVNKHDKEALYRYYTGKTMEMKILVL